MTTPTDQSVEAAARAILEFHDSPAEAKRPDVYARRMETLRAALARPLEVAAPVDNRVLAELAQGVVDGLFTKGSSPIFRDRLHSDVLATLKLVASRVPVAAIRLDWQHIDSAPRDGTNIIAGVAGLARSTGEMFWWEGGWRTWDGENHKRTEAYPTHWAPIPFVPMTAPAVVQPTPLEVAAVTDAEVDAAVKLHAEKLQTFDGTRHDLMRQILENFVTPYIAQAQFDRTFPATQPHKPQDAAPVVEPCQNPNMPPYECKNRHQCWEPCGELGHSAEHARVARVQPTPVLDAMELALKWLEDEAVTYEDGAEKWERHGKAVQALKNAIASAKGVQS